MYAPYSKDIDSTADTQQGLSCLCLIRFIIVDDNGIRRLGTAVLRLSHADDLHDFVMGTDDTFDDPLGLWVEYAAFLVVLSVRFMRVCLARAIYDIIIRRATLRGKVGQQGLKNESGQDSRLHTSAWDVNGPSLPILRYSGKRGSRELREAGNVEAD